MSGKNNHGWKGGFYKSDDRIFIYVPNHPFNNGKYVLRARLIIEKFIGKYLTKEEQVHHINEDKSDDRLENLQIVTVSEHAKIHKFWKAK